MSYRINTLVSSDKVVASYEKRLSICLTPNGFSFSMTTTRNELLTLGEVTHGENPGMAEMIGIVRNVLAEANIQPIGIKDKQLIVPADKFVWIPEKLYDEANKRNYIESLYTVGQGREVVSAYNPAVKAYIVFVAESAPQSAFKIAIPGLQVSCQHDRMACTTLMDNSDMKSLLAINIRDRKTDYAVFCNKKLQISNTFDCANFDETLYHALNLTKQFHLEDADMLTAVFGDVDRQQYARMCKYLPNMALYTGRPLTMANPEMQQMPRYRYALILS